ncbi:metal ABC transporter ATP-binding protein [Mumia zhuanghuii]|uniref:Metal ABC transporter ATP-binding protein n=1 Tax=Mumia zhuanghuii TaxID=2585211 RepID=A0A5C4MBB6_9ACTN|nr:metal ABC transporter ATP-binding protein [Mumia zhuanghuii]TNC33490.1 metal ABC transporter ATP-binding protein [Mumia zhuanghuii]TNC43209.1 metal ABC transporter ATP-binding protein [Mumia zhuanghuii]
MTETAPLAVKDLRVSLAAREVVRGVSLTIAPGQFVVLLGSNGSGKTTLMRAAMGVIPAASGEVRLFGTPLRRFRQHQRIGYVPQRSTAAAGVPSTVHEVVMSGRLSRRPFAGLASRDDKAAVNEALALVDLSEYAKTPASELSGGQQQRVMIARGLASRPDLLVMDEPTAGVDARSQLGLAELFGRLLSEGRTIFMVAHELGPFEPMIDRAVVLRDGRVAYDGPCSGGDLAAEAEPHNQHHPHLTVPQHHVGIEESGAWPA